MSLLLEALKKAEQAKQGETTQQTGAGARGGSPAGGEGLALAPEDAPKPGSHGMGTSQPITRDRLPDITQNLEILSDDLAPENATPVRASARNTASAPRPSATRIPETDTSQRDADREAARQLFEAHAVDYDPRRPFKLVLAGLAFAMVGIVIYFWWQIQPRTATFVAQPPPQPPSQQIAAAPPPTPPVATPVESSPPEPQPESPPASEPPVPQSSAAAAPVAAAPAAAAAVAAVPTPPQPMAAPRPTVRRSEPTLRTRAAPEEQLPGARGTMSISRSQSGVDAALKSGYAALQSGDLITARTEYERALRADPRNRDALLGMAAVDVRTGNYDDAATQYARALELDPRDPDAAAGLIGLRGSADPVQAESRLKTLIAGQPDSAVLHFALGNVFATQSRWADAQLAYFRAVVAEPENPDYEFNLAVSLDHLRKEKLALDHYQRALALAASRSAGFNKSQAEARIHDLQR